MTAFASHDHPVPLELVQNHIRRLRRTTGVIGALVATLDGRTVASDLYETSPGAAAAITASSLGLGGRLGDLVGHGPGLLELQARTSGGYVCIYAIGDDWLLAVLTDLAVNRALMKLDVRDAVEALESSLKGPRRGHRPTHRQRADLRHGQRNGI